jgi:hypothetical protein
VEVDGLGREDDLVPGVVGDGHDLVVREEGGQQERCRAEPPLAQAVLHDVRDVRPHRLGDRVDVRVEACGAGGVHGVDDDVGVRHQVHGQAGRLHRLGQQLDQPPGEPGQVAAVGHPVVAHGLGALDGDPRAVGLQAVERLER